MKVALIKIARIFHIERYFVIYPHKCTLKKLKKKYQEKWENAYLIVKNARASRALRQALDPGQYFMARFARQTSLHSPDFASLRRQNIGKNFWGPPLDQILDPLLLVVPWMLLKWEWYLCWGTWMTTDIFTKTIVQMVKHFEVPPKNV